MNKTAYFRHALTGKVDKYPDHYADLFPDVLERVEAKDYNCVDCGPKTQPSIEADFATVGSGEGNWDQSANEGQVFTNDDENEAK